jgi:hypothetical protein
MAMPRFMETAKRITVKKAKAARFLALALCVLLVATSFFAEIYILTHTNHEHDFRGINSACATCEQLTATVNFLNQFSVALIKTATLTFCLLAVLSLSGLNQNQANLASPVTLKVKMNK